MRERMSGFLFGFCAALLLCASYAAGRAQSAAAEERDGEERQSAEKSPQEGMSEAEAWTIFQSYCAKTAYAPKQTAPGMGSEQD